MYDVLRAELTGISPLMLHNPQLSDPLNPFSKQLKAVTSKRKRSDSDYEDMAHIEFIGGLYLNEKKQVIIPATNIEGMITAGFKKNRLGQESKSAIMVENDALLIYEGPQGDPEAMYQEKRFVDRRVVVVNKARVMRTRPIFHAWKLNIEVSYLSEILNRSQVEEALTKGGRFCALGDARPRFGRFDVGFRD